MSVHLYKSLKPMSYQRLMALALSKKGPINAYQLSELAPNLSAGAFYIRHSHAVYILSQLESEGYIQHNTHIFTIHPKAKNYIITEHGQNRLERELHNLGYIYSTLKTLSI